MTSECNSAFVLLNFGLQLRIFEMATINSMTQNELFSLHSLLHRSPLFLFLTFISCHAVSFPIILILFPLQPSHPVFKRHHEKRSQEVRNSDANGNACETPTNSSGETYHGIGKSKTKYACIVEADDSTRIRLEGVGSLQVS